MSREHGAHQQLHNLGERVGAIADALAGVVLVVQAVQRDLAGVRREIETLREEYAEDAAREILHPKANGSANGSAPRPLRSADDDWREHNG